MGGKPFQKGHDPRRHLAGRPKSSGTPTKTLRQLARESRKETFTRLEQLRDQLDDLKIALEASRILAAYSDGEPGAANVPVEADDTPGTEGEDAKILELLRQPEDE